MKRLAIAMALSILLMGCSESARDTQGRSVAEKNENGSFSVTILPGCGPHTFHYVMVDGHEYLLMWGTHRSGITHSPKCGCRKHLVLEYPEDWRDSKPETNAIPIPIPLEHHKPRPCGRLARPSEFR